MTNSTTDVHSMMETSMDSVDMAGNMPANVITLITNNNTSTYNKNIPPKKQDEQITSAVMKVLKGYQWNLVANTAK